VVQAGLISPAIGTQGETLVVTITGSGFVSGATTVQFGGSTSGITVNSLTVLSAGEILVNISISPTAPTAPSGGGAPVLVTNGTATSQIGVFAVARAALTLSPSSGTQGETLDVTLTGMTFGPGTTVLFGGGASGITVNSVTVVNASVATANITISPTAPLATFNRFGQGGVLVRVTTATSSLTSRFGVYPAALTLSPTTATQGETLDVTLTGMTFGPGTTVQFGVSTSGITLNFLTVVSPSEAIANITISPTAQIANITRTGGGVLVRVNNGTSNLTSRFGVGPATLTLSPDIGTQGETLDVTLTGMTFSPGTTVQFSGSNSGITVNSVTVVSASEAIANITIGRTQPPSIINQFGGGGVAVRVNTATSALTGRFSVGSAALTVSPNVGTQGETLDVTLTGMTFDPSTTVQFLGTNSGITVNSLTVVSASVAVANITISPTAPLAAFLPNGRGGIAVRVNTAAFGLTGRFGVGPETLIVSPASGQKGQTLNVALSGLTFGPGTSVQIGGGNTGITVNSVTVLSASEVIANVSISPTAPVSSAIGRSVQVNTGAFVFNQANAFAVLAP
jgi:hypothetical protein